MGPRGGSRIRKLGFQESRAGRWGSTCLRGLGAGRGRGFANISCHRVGRNCGFKIENIGGRIKMYGMLLELFVVLRPVRRLRGRESNG